MKHIAMTKKQILLLLCIPGLCAAFAYIIDPDHLSAGALPGGIYLCRLETEAHTAVRKMVLLG